MNTGTATGNNAHLSVRTKMDTAIQAVFDEFHIKLLSVVF